MIIITIDRIRSIILQRIIHPTKIPLIVKAQSILFRRCCYIWEIGAILRNHHDSRKFLMHVIVQTFHKVNSTIIGSSITITSPINKIRNRIDTNTIHMIHIYPERCRGHQERTYFFIPQIKVHRTPFRIRIVFIWIFI